MNTLFTEIKNKIDNGQPDDAILMANQLIKEGNEDAYLYYLKGRAYMKKSDWKKAIEYISQGKIDLSKLITHKVGLDDAFSALKMMHDKKEFFCKVMIENEK